VARTLKFREDEKILAHLEPYPLAFADFYAFFLYLASLGAIFIVFNPQMNTAIQGLIPDWGRDIALSVIWFACVIIPFVVIAVVKIAWRWLLLSIGISASGAILKFYFNIPYGLQIPAVIIGVVGFALVDFYRRRFDFYITDQRILIELNFISQKRREIPYNKISDLVVEKGWLGRIFNYGSVIPITESGFGLGEDVAAITVGTTASALPKDSKTTAAVSGGKDVLVPRGRSFYVLFGVRNPRVVSEMISHQIHGYEETPYLKKIAAGIDSLIKKEEEKEKK
jgi:membrane protein YdbS with pleckstrin-like domain